ncbi:MAG: shikimate kinase [Bacteroidales bacterium]|nr:shikimate kinase [Bacteroidales bacterium]
MRIYLIGFMGSGKSTAGKKLANKLALDFFDLDDLIEQESAMTIAEYFENFGEAKFRELENIVLQKTFQLENVLISTGGGTPCFFNAIDEINENGISVYLKAEIPLIISRLKDEKNQRPLIKSKNNEELKEYLNSLLEQRKIHYEKAHIVVDAKSLNIAELTEHIKFFVKE